MSVYRGVGIIFVSLLLFACSREKEHKAEDVAIEFMSALKLQEFEKMRVIYPAVENIEIFYASDHFEVIGVEGLPGSVFQVNILSHYKNEEGVQEENLIELFIEKEREEQTSNLIIFDSKGISSLESYPHYKFAVNTGCIDVETYLTDQQAHQKLLESKQMLFAYAKDLYIILEENVRVVSATITQHSSNRATGRAVISNESPFNLPILRYMIVYYDESSQIIHKDKGVVTNEPLLSGKSLVFDFVTQFDEKAANAAFKIEFDLDLILEFVMQDESYSGREYEEFENRNIDQEVEI